MLARRLFGAYAGLIAAAITLASHRLFFLARSGADDTGFVFYALASLVVLQAASRRPTGAGFALGGLLAALATLEKATGIFLLGVVTVAALSARAGPWAVRARYVAAATLPIFAAFGAYLGRNWLGYGDLRFRFSALEWRLKDGGFEAFFAFYERAPGLAETLVDLGARRVLEIVWDQLMAFVTNFSPFQSQMAFPAIVVPAFLPVCALLCLPWLLRRDRAFGAMVLAVVVSSVAFVCVLYHAEPRYFALLIPLVAIVIAGALTGPVASFAARAGARIGQTVPGVIAVLLVATAAVPTEFVSSGQARVLCLPVYEWIRDSTPASARVLTNVPSTLAWKADRAAVRIPSGGVDALLAVARHYRTEWLMFRPLAWTATSGLATANRLARSGAPPLKAVQVQTHGACEVYRLNLEPAVASSP